MFIIPSTFTHQPSFWNNIVNLIWCQKSSAYDQQSQVSFCASVLNICQINFLNFYIFHWLFSTSRAILNGRSFLSHQSSNAVDNVSLSPMRDKVRGQPNLSYLSRLASPVDDLLFMPTALIFFCKQWNAAWHGLVAISILDFVLLV